MDEYVSTVSLECNGQEIDDFQTFEEDPRVLRSAVKLMKKTGVMGVTPQYGFTVSYVIPRNKPEFDFESVQGGTFVVDYENGTRVTFTGVSVLEIGSVKSDGQKETTKDIKFIAANRVKE